MLASKLPVAPSAPSAPPWRDQRVHLRTVVPGPMSRALRRREDEHLAPGLQGYAVMSGVAIESGAGSLLTDVDGNALLDFIGGIGVGALGHSHPRIASAIADQVTRVSIGSFTSAPRVELVESVARHAPSPELHRLQLYTSGAEAVESALRLARSHTGKHEVVSFWGGFHGKTHGALSLLGSSAGKSGYGPMAPGAHQIPYADCFRCPLKLTHPACGLACVELGRKQLRAQSAGAIAAFIVEPMQGTAGNVVPPDDFLPAVQQLAREHDAVLIADEMITGFGRTGRYWGASHSGVVPDIVVIGKALGGGFPLSGLLTTDAIAHAKPWSNPSGSSSSYGGNALGAAAGAAALRIVDEENLVDNARAVGAWMLEELRKLEQDYPFVGHVDGRGLFLRIELVASKLTREALPRPATERIFHECLRRGLLAMAYAPSFRLQPALTIDRATAGNGMAILREVFDAIKAQGAWRVR